MCRRLALLLVGLFSCAAVSVVPLSLPAAATADSTEATQQSSGVDIGSVYRLYLAYFGREPDAAGFWFWVDRLEAGGSLVSVSEQFALSPEYVASYGNLDDQAFLDQAYTAVFDRSPDAGGREFWLRQMASGTPRGQVMIAFSDSTEYRLKTGFLSEEAVERLYRAVFLREADTAGLRFWLDQAATGSSFVEIASAMAASPEFVGRYGNLDDAAFVNQVFLNVLGRGPDSSGGPFWTARLADGAPRGEIIWEFSVSPEFQERTGLFDREQPTIPQRPGTEPPPVVPVQQRDVLPQGPPAVYADFTDECWTEVLETRLDPKTDDAVFLLLRYRYGHTPLCERDFSLATVVIDGPNRSSWDFVTAGYSPYRDTVHGYIQYEVPVTALNSNSALEIEAAVYAGETQITWDEEVNLPLPKVITVRTPSDPVAFGIEQIVLPIEVEANPAAPTRELELHVRIGGSCSIEGAESELFGGYQRVGSGSGSFVFDLTVDIGPGDRHCSGTVKTDDGDSEVAFSFRRSAPPATTFSISGDATCPGGECLIEIATAPTLEWQRQAFEIRAIDAPKRGYFGAWFQIDDVTGIGSAAARGPYAAGFCLQLQSTYGSLEPALGQERCFLPSGDEWVEA